MPNSYTHKKSSVPSKVPANTDILVAEIAINLSDRILHSKDTANNIFLVKADPLYNTGLQDNLDLKSNVANPIFTGTATAPTFTATIANGSAPLIVTSNTIVTNLNADFLDGQHGTFYTANSIFASHTSNIANPHTVTKLQVGLGNVTDESKATMFSSPTFTGSSTANNLNVTGTLQVTSNSLVTNLNADLLDGQHGTFYATNTDFTTHTSNVANPHAVTKLQVGLGNVTNESKATLFTNPAFTGNVSITGLLQVTSNTLVTNLNADFLDGQHGTYYTANSIFAAHTSNVANPHATTALQVGLENVTNESKATLFTSPTFTGVTTTANTFTSTVASGNAPFVVTSNTLVTNLNADLLDGQHGSYYTTANNLTGTIPSAVLPNSGVTANTYGSLTTIPVITVNAKGLVTGVSTATVAGAVLQVVNATYSTSTGNNSGSYVNTGLTASITPTSASSKIFVFGVVNGTNSQGSTATGIQMGLYKGTSATIIANLGTYLTYNTSSTNNYAGSVSFGYQDSPNTTSAVTYGVAFLRSIGSGNIYVQLDSSVSSITLMEIAG